MNLNPSSTAVLKASCKLKRELIRKHDPYVAPYHYQREISFAKLLDWKRSSNRRSAEEKNDEDLGEHNSNLPP